MTARRILLFLLLPLLWLTPDPRTIAGAIAGDWGGIGATPGVLAVAGTVDVAAAGSDSGKVTAIGSRAEHPAEWPTCTAATSGIVACIAGRLCRCGAVRGGSIIGQASGYRWDCGVLRPYCHRPPVSAPPRHRPDDLRLIVPVSPPQAPDRPRHRPQPKPATKQPP